MLQAISIGCTHGSSRWPLENRKWKEWKQAEAQATEPDARSAFDLTSARPQKDGALHVRAWAACRHEGRVLLGPEQRNLLRKFWPADSRTSQQKNRTVHLPGPTSKHRATCSGSPLIMLRVPSASFITADGNVVKINSKLSSNRRDLHDLGPWAQGEGSFGQRHIALDLRNLNLETKTSYDCTHSPETRSLEARYFTPRKLTDRENASQSRVHPEAERCNSFFACQWQ